MIDWKKKLSSRKFWAAVANFAVNVVTFCLSPSGSPERITALVLSFGGFVAYIVAEGLVDAAREKETVEIIGSADVETAEPEYDTQGEGL